jgi:dihydrodipicolinate synthase/N-acetylneuraminate lyase
VLDRSSFGGVWAAVQAPWDRHDRLDAGVLRENVARLAAAGLDGIYGPDTDAEFFSMEIEDYRAFVTTLADEAARRGVAAMAGATWITLRGALDRLRIAADAGLGGAHLGHLTYLPMLPAEVWRFWDAAAAAVPEGFGLVHYETQFIATHLDASDYLRLAARHPSFVGTKQTTRDPGVFGALVAGTPGLPHFTLDQVLEPFLRVGAAGVNSWLATFNAPYVVAWYRECREGDPATAAAKQRDVARFAELRAEAFGRWGKTAVQKSLAAASDFLVPAPRVRAPYGTAPASAIRAFRERVEREFPDLVWRP